MTRVAAAIAHIGSAGGVRTNTDVDLIESSPETAAQVGLVLSEILTNCYQHAFEGREHGLVAVSLKQDGDAVLTLLTLGQVPARPLGEEAAR